MGLCGTINMCTGAAGRMSRNAITRESRKTTVAGTSPAMIFSKSVGISYASDGSGGHKISRKPGGASISGSAARLLQCSKVPLLVAAPAWAMNGNGNDSHIEWVYGSET